MKIALICASIIICLVGCAPVEVREAVMTDGMRICATTEKDGEVCIVAEGQRYRHISWDGVTRTSKMVPRKERWVGMLGLMNPGYEQWEYHKGITWANYVEGQLHYPTETEAAEMFKVGGFDPTTYVYTHDGLAVYYQQVIRPDRKAGNMQLNVIQLMVNGRKPKNLSGSRDEMITVEYGVKP